MVIVKRKELSLAEKLYLPEIVRALSISLRVIFKPKVTRQYPEEPLPTDAVTRGQPRSLPDAFFLQRPQDRPPTRLHGSGRGRGACVRFVRMPVLRYRRPPASS